jgi:predicted metal-binding protein
MPASALERPPSLSGVKPGSSTIVSVCTSCRAASSSEAPRAGEAMLDALAPELLDGTMDATLRPVGCLGVCKRPVTIAISAPDGYTFVFGDLGPHDGPAAIASFARSYREADYGFVPWAARPELLRTRLVARIPSALWSPQDGRPPR